MGMTLFDFIAGDKAKLIAAMKNDDSDAIFDALDDKTISQARADMNIHIVPSDLDRLSILISSISQKPLTDLRSHQRFLMMISSFFRKSSKDLRSHLAVIVDEEDRGLLEVDRKWVSYVAAVPSEKTSDLAESWARSYNDKTQVTAEMKASVAALVQLCKTALANNIPVVHIWMD